MNVWGMLVVVALVGMHGAFEYDIIVRKKFYIILGGSSSMEFGLLDI